MVKINDTVANIKRVMVKLSVGESCSIRKTPKRYKLINKKMATQMAKKISRFNSPACKTKSALDKNLKAIANSKNPNTTFTLLSHPPDFGNALSHEGNKANNPKGNPNPKPNPAIPTVSALAPPPVDNVPPNNAPNTGPVQLNDTNTKVSAIKKIPIIPPLFDAESALFIHELGKVISKAPKKLMAKTTKMIKKNTLR